EPGRLPVSPQSDTMAGNPARHGRPVVRRHGAPTRRKVSTGGADKRHSTRQPLRSDMAKHIRAANAAYEDWLRKELDGELVEADLVEKHEKMSESPFSFLRATYWRWAETILTICPDLEEAPSCLGIGDIHLENFGTWRDVDGRLVWGVNDFDEAAKMP